MKFHKNFHMTIDGSIAYVKSVKKLFNRRRLLSSNFGVIMLLRSSVITSSFVKVNIIG